MKKIFFLLNCLFLTVATSSAATAPGASFLKFGVGARADAMGEAFVAVANDVTAAYWNPAGLAQLAGPELSVSHIEYYESVRHENVAFAFPLGDGALALSGTYLWIDGIRGKESPDAAERSIPVWDAAPAVSYGMAMTDRVGVGATIKGIYQTLDDKNASGYAADAGVLVLAGDRYAVGAVVQNLGQVSAFISEAAPLPTTAKIGVSGRFGRLLADIDGAYGVNDGVLDGSAGLEYRLMPLLLLRLGYKYNSTLDKNDLLDGGTAGIGIQIKKFGVDYAFVPHADLGYTHRITVRAKF